MHHIPEPVEKRCVLLRKNLWDFLKQKQPKVERNQENQKRQEKNRETIRRQHSCRFKKSFSSFKKKQSN